MPSSSRCLWPFTFILYLYHLVYLVPPQFFGHELHIGSVRLFSLSKISYSYYSSLAISSSRVQFALHLPSHVKPRWATLTVYDYHYKDSECEVSLGKLDVTFWVFPLLSRISAGPLLAVELNDFRVRIFNSKSTPTWIERLRRSLVATVLQGETIRLDDLKTKVVFSCRSPNSNPGNEQIKADEHETRVSLSSEHWHILGLNRRLYTFGKLEAQLRRCWVGDRGSFVLIAEECRWVKAPSPTLRQWGFSSPSFWLQVVQNILTTPFNVSRIYRDPMSAIDLYVPRTDVTFENFRIRDAELFIQGTDILVQEWAARTVDGRMSAFWDRVLQEIIVFCSH